MTRANLVRLLTPSTVAVVGASENLGMSNNAVLPMLDAGREVFLVNPNRETVYDRKAFKTLSDIGRPVDAVLSLVSADRSVDVVREAAALGCGGVAVAAGGFAELGESGHELQARLIEAARHGGAEPIAVVGPNCAGYMNVRNATNLFTGGRITLRRGGVAVLSQSGFLVRSCLSAGQQRQLGFGAAVSTGNEAVCGLADYIDVLADDAETRVICLVIEKIREPDTFFSAVARARSAGQVVIATKLGRTDKSREIMRSHTGAIADESWVYDLVLRQAGVLTANDIDEMMDKAQLLAQLPVGRRRPVRGVAVVTSSGGVAGVAADAAVDAGVPLADLHPLESWVRERVPGDGPLNPLDMTGFVMRDRELMKGLFAGIAGADPVDALILCWWAGEGDEGWSRLLLEPYAEVAEAAQVPLIVTPVEATAVGGWTSTFSERGVMFCRGLASTYRALSALGQAASGPPPFVPVRISPRPSTPPAPLIETAAGPMVGFADAMSLLQESGIPVAPWLVVDESIGDGALDALVSGPAVVALGDRLVVKLADVAHRTELDAVRVGVSRSELAEAILNLRAVAKIHGVPATVAVQSMVSGHGEAFIGLQTESDFGPILLFGRGGVLVEVAGKVDGRLLPLAEGASARLVDGVVGVEAMAGLRGQQRWPLVALAATVDAVGRFWERNGTWLHSADLNPLIVTAHGVVAVDALLIARR